VISPYSRWLSKDWPLQNYCAVSKSVAENFLVLFTGTDDRRPEIDAGLRDSGDTDAINLAGKLSLLEFVELAGRASLVLTGDSFPMHVAGARGTPVVALFGPTDETRVGPRGKEDQVIRVEGCDTCDLKSCPRLCLQRLQPGQVIVHVNNHLESLATG
jgi:ADP-heptose:LPS heptosyltransferase